MTSTPTEPRSDHITGRSDVLGAAVDDTTPTLTTERALELYGRHTCQLQRHLLHRRQTSAAHAATIIIRTIHDMAGVPMPDERKPR